MAKRLAPALSVLLVVLFLVAPALAHAADSQFNIFYSGTEDLVLSRLMLDPSTHRVANLNDAATAVYQDNYRPPALSSKRSRPESRPEWAPC